MRMRMSENCELPKPELPNIEPLDRSLERKIEKEDSLRIDSFRDVADGLQQAAGTWRDMCDKFERLGQESKLSEVQHAEFSQLKGEVCDALLKGAEKLYDFVDGPEKSTLEAGRNILEEIKKSPVTDGHDIIKECQEIGSVIGAFFGVLITAIFKGLTLAAKAYSVTKDWASALAAGLEGFFSELFKGLESLEAGSPEGFQDGSKLHNQPQDGETVPENEAPQEMTHEG